MKLQIFMIIVLALALFACEKQVEAPEATPVVNPEPTPVEPAPEHEPVPEPTCDDGIRNQGEVDVDCGGPCAVCITCDDGIRNQGEVDVDCGGPCSPCEISYEIKAEDATALQEKLKPTTKGVFLRNTDVKGLNVGQSIVFPLGIGNIEVDEKDFEISVIFWEARNLKSNPIETVDSDTILEWFEENEWETYTLGEYEQALIPVGVTVGEEIAPGVATVPGNYYFKLLVEYPRGISMTDYIELDFSFKVV